MNNVYKKLVPELVVLMELIPDLKFHYELEDNNCEYGCLVLRCFMCNKVRSYNHEDEISQLLNYFNIDQKRKNFLWHLFDVENKTRGFIYVCQLCLDKVCVGYNKETGDEL